MGGGREEGWGDISLEGGGVGDISTYIHSVDTLRRHSFRISKPDETFSINFFLSPSMHTPRGIFRGVPMSLAHPHVSSHAAQAQIRLQETESEQPRLASLS